MKLRAAYHSGLRGYKHDLTEGGIRVPGILEYPALIKKNVVTNYPAATMDYLPTFLDVVGIAHPNPSWPLDGTSLLPLVRGEVSTRSQGIGHIFEQGSVSGGRSTPWDSWGPFKNEAKGMKVTPSKSPSGLSEPSEEVMEKAFQISWRVDNLKLYGWRPDKKTAWEYAVFDIHKDLGENENVASEHANEFKQMFKDMWKWAEGVYESQQSETMCASKLLV